MSNRQFEHSLEQYCPACDAQEVLVNLKHNKRPDHTVEIECPKCSYKRIAVMRE